MKVGEEVADAFCDYAKDEELKWGYCVGGNGHITFASPITQAIANAFEAGWDKGYESYGVQRGLEL